MGYSDARGGRFGQACELLRYKLENRARFADVKYRSFSRIRELLEGQLGDLAGKCLYEVGCGQWQTNVRLLDALGADVAAVDPELPPRTPFGYPGFALAAGFQRAAKTALNEVFFRRAFDRRLQELSGLTFGKCGARLWRRGAERVPLADGSVDAAFSDDVYEHLPDVAAVTAEMARVLRPGGTVLVIIHPFAAYSGGHHPATIRHDGAQGELDVPPWDHLRDNTRPSGVYCNGVRAAEYRRIFDAHFETLSWETMGPEGEQYLSDEILAALPDHDRDELLTGKITFLGRKA